MQSNSPHHYLTNAVLCRLTPLSVRKVCVRENKNSTLTPLNLFNLEFSAFTRTLRGAHQRLSATSTCEQTQSEEKKKQRKNSNSKGGTHQYHKTNRRRSVFQKLCVSRALKTPLLARLSSLILNVRRVRHSYQQCKNRLPEELEIFHHVSLFTPLDLPS